MWRRSASAGLLAFGILAGGVEAALPSPPFELNLLPSPPRRAEVITLRVHPTKAVAVAPDVAVDVYVMRTTISGMRWYLTPEGSWSRTIVAHRARIGVRAWTDVEGRWIDEETRFGWSSIAVWFVHASTHPLHRENHVFDALVTDVFVRPPRAVEWGARAFVLAWAAPVALVGWAVIFLYGRVFRRSHRVLGGLAPESSASATGTRPDLCRGSGGATPAASGGRDASGACSGTAGS